jgi:hypothetical protein
MTNYFTLEDGEIEVDKPNQVLFRTAKEFSMFITNMAEKNQDTISNTLIQYCEDRDVDPEDLVKLISKPLKERLAEEYRESGLLEKTSTASF